MDYGLLRIDLEAIALTGSKWVLGDPNKNQKWATG